MNYITGTTQFKLENTAVCLGKFDGLHKGHMELIHQILKYKDKGYNSVMFTFDYHPSNLFSDKETQLIYTEEEKRKKLEELGVDTLIAYPFTKQTASTSPDEFIKDILVNKLGAKVVIVGSDFCFGRNREGNTKLLQQASSEYGFKLIICSKIQLNNKEISSTLIRNELLNGNMELASEMLDKPFSISGEVLHGKKIGRTLGMPTTNLVPDSIKLLPPNGVYISKTIIDGEYFEGITNIGYKPTVGDNKRGVETFIFDFNDDLYGKEIEVLLYHFVRAEQKFDSLEELKKQMLMDIDYGKEYFRPKQKYKDIMKLLNEIFI